MNDATVIASDGYALNCRHYGNPETAHAAVLIAGAMGVSQRYYERFAVWLAEQGYSVTTFDYRGIGRSAPASLRGFEATITDWIELDCQAMINATTARNPDLPLVWLGHSLGGQILPMVPDSSPVSGMLMVASGNGYWRLHDFRTKVTAWILWYLSVRLAIRIAGYFPGRRLGKVGDLPAGVMLQWRKWCLDPLYAAGTENASALAAYKAFRKPIVSVSVDDDEFMSVRNTEELHRMCQNAQLSERRIAPADLGVQRIGHFGIFRKEFEPTLWKHYLLSGLKVVLIQRERDS